jgi:hypothetical protein
VDGVRLYLGPEHPHAVRNAAEAVALRETPLPLLEAIERAAHDRAMSAHG